jgi:hypothetical protein
MVKSTKKKKNSQPRKQIIIKRSSGRKEEFDMERMAKITSRSGVPFLMARDIAKKVSNKIKHESRNKKADGLKGRRSKKQQTKSVTAGRVSGLIAKELRDRNQANIAASYSGDTSQNRIRYKNMKQKEPVVGLKNRRKTAR